jgi:hypothetical protein
MSTLKFHPGEATKYQEIATFDTFEKKSRAALTDDLIGKAEERKGRTAEEQVIFEEMGTNSKQLWKYLESSIIRKDEDEIRLPDHPGLDTTRSKMMFVSQATTHNARATCALCDPPPEAAHEKTHKDTDNSSLSMVWLTG